MSKRLEFSDDGMKSWRTLGACTDEEFPDKWFFRAVDDSRDVQAILDEVNNKVNPHKGSSLRSLFEELGEWDEVEAMAHKKINTHKKFSELHKGMPVYRRVRSWFRTRLTLTILQFPRLHKFLFPQDWK